MHPTADLHLLPMKRHPRRLGLAAFGATVLALCAGPTAASEPAWPVAGQQGLVRFVIVPAGKVTDEAAYQEQVVRLCEPDRTCFLNFYTNTSGAAAEVPLPEAIANEATATYRRSMKNGVQLFTWSCRLKLPGKDCF